LVRRQSKRDQSAYVEHNDDNLYMLRTRLELRGDFEVLAAEDSETGCRLAATEHPLAWPLVRAGNMSPVISTIVTLRFFARRQHMSTSAFFTNR